MSDSIEVVFFDAAGTLFEVRGSVGEIYGHVALRYGIQSQPGDLDRAFTQAFLASPPMAFPGLEGADLVRAERLWWFRIVRSVFAGTMPEMVLESYFDDVFEVFRRAAAWQLFPDTRSSLARLHSLGYRLGIISNFDSRLRDLLADLGIDSLFEQTVISSRAGAAKPAPGIFQEALRLMTVPPSRALHVGDSMQEDVEGARGAGLHAVLLDRQGLYVDWTRGWREENLASLCESLGAWGSASESRS